MEPQKVLAVITFPVGTPDEVIAQELCAKAFRVGGNVQGILLKSNIELIVTNSQTRDQVLEQLRKQRQAQGDHS